MIIAICTRAIEFLFYALFFLVPLIFLPVNYELFEFNKMILTYAITVLIAGFWTIKMVLQGRISIQRTPLDIPILLFLASQIISTIASIDVHTSVWGYYSRSNGGLASIISYIFLYYAFVSNFTKRGVVRVEGLPDSAQSPPKASEHWREGNPRQDPERGINVVKRLLLIVLASGALVATYGVFERFGIDKDYWVQDVQNRVFSTLGQPNWLAAYLSILIPIAIAFGMKNSKHEARNAKQYHNTNVQKFKTFLISNFRHSNLFRISVFGFSAFILFYLVLLFTKSRSGFLGLWTGLLFFFFAYFWIKRKEWWHKLSPTQFILRYWYLLVVLVSLGLITFLVGSPFEQLNRFTLDGIHSRLQPTTYNLQPTDKPQGPALEAGGTESGEIRKIVWEGAIDIAKHYPFFGSGVETFAYSYYQFRPIEHNKTSEWDFLYNKAHNEYLNYLANTGIFGLGSYLLIIGVFLLTAVKGISNVKFQMSNFKSGSLEIGNLKLVIIGLFAGYTSILVSNFFGFSVVIINLFFFLIPASVFVLNDQLNPARAIKFSFGTAKNKEVSSIKYQVLSRRGIAILLIILTTYYLLLTTYQMWSADRDFAKGKNLGRSGEFVEAYPFLVAAIQKRSGEPLFSEELSTNTSNLAIAAYETNDSTLSSQLIKEAIRQSDYTIKISPNNPNFWRTRLRIFYTLGQIDEKYYEDALSAAKRAAELSPTDPKIGYNLGLLLGQTGKLSEAISELKRTIALKPDYRDPIYALGLFYYDKATDAQGGIIDQELFNKAIVQMEAVLKISSQDAEAAEKLRKWRGF